MCFEVFTGCVRNMGVTMQRTDGPWLGFNEQRLMPLCIGTRSLFTFASIRRLLMKNHYSDYDKSSKMLVPFPSLITA